MNNMNPSYIEYAGEWEASKRQEELMNKKEHLTSKFMQYNVRVKETKRKSGSPLIFTGKRQ